MAGTLINNVAYSWSMVRLSTTLTSTADTQSEILMGVSSIKWSTEQKVENNYGIGGRAINRGFGNITHTASITFDYNTRLQMLGLVPGATSLRDLGEFDLTVSWAKDMGIDDVTTETVTLKKCFFNEDGMEVSQDDTNITKEYQLNPFDIESNITV